MLLLSSAVFFTFSKKSFRNTITVSSGLDPNCLQRLSADNDVARMLKKLPTTKGDYWIQGFSLASAIGHSPKVVPDV